MNTSDDQSRMLTIQDARGIVYLTNQHDTPGAPTTTFSYQGLF